MVDTTCGSVLNVWKNVKRYAQDGFTSIIHGKVWHEETQATASQALDYEGGHFLVVLNLEETRRGLRLHPQGGDRARVSRRGFATPSRPGSIPTATSQRIGLANQTTMLMSESLQVQEMLRAGHARPLWRRGARLAIPRVRHHLQRDAGPAGRGGGPADGQTPLDLMVVIGGYNSSNTCNLARICAEQVPTFHIADPLPGIGRRLRYRPAGRQRGNPEPRAGCPRLGNLRLG